MPLIITYEARISPSRSVVMAGCFDSINHYQRFANLECRRPCYNKKPFQIIHTTEITEQRASQILQ